MGKARSNFAKPGSLIGNERVIPAFVNIGTPVIFIAGV